MRLRSLSEITQTFLSSESPRNGSCGLGWRGCGAHFRAEGKARAREEAMKMGPPLHLRGKAGDQGWLPSSLQEGGQGPTVFEHPLCILSWAPPHAVSLPLTLPGRSHHLHFTGGKTEARRHTCSPRSLRWGEQRQESSSSLSDAKILAPSLCPSPLLGKICLWPQECRQWNYAPLPMPQTCFSGLRGSLRLGRP